MLPPEADAKTQRALAAVLMIVMQDVPRDMTFSHEHRGREAWKESKEEFSDKTFLSAFTQLTNLKCLGFPGSWVAIAIT
jgi:hypothetical protein